MFPCNQWTSRIETELTIIGVERMSALTEALVELRQASKLSNIVEKIKGISKIWTNVEKTLVAIKEWLVKHFTGFLKGR
jgi:hypothetical protein